MPDNQGPFEDVPPDVPPDYTPPFIDTTRLEWHHDMQAYWDPGNEQWVTQEFLNAMQNVVPGPAPDRLSGLREFVESNATPDASALTQEQIRRAQEQIFRYATNNDRNPFVTMRNVTTDEGVDAVHLDTNAPPMPAPEMGDVEHDGDYVYCSQCDELTNPDYMYTHATSGMRLCEDCWERRCESCGSTEYHPEEHRFNESRGTYECPGCRGSRRRDLSNNRRIQEGNTETVDEAADARSDAEMEVLPIPGRETIRRTGIEIEGAGNGEAVAAAMYGAGVSQYDHVTGYHTQTRAGTGHHTGFTVETDATVDWELVSPVIMLNDKASVKQLNTAMDVLRNLHKEGTIGFDTRCGLHVHIEAMPTNATGAFNLASLWNYMEDVIYRLGAAKWPAHRALVEGENYATPIPKNYTTVREFGRRVGDAPDRYNALSFANFFQSLFNQCVCGAVRYDDWSNCTCSLGKCTFEFRVFNTTANKTKLNAYLAFCQAMVAKAVSLGEPLDSDDFPALEFCRYKATELQTPMRDRLIESWKPRLTFLFNDLPLTDSEKKSLLYCIRHSELALVGEEFINTLSTNPEIQEVTA